MSQRFIKFIDSEEAAFLLRKHPKAFLLLHLIAKRARTFSGDPDGLEIGEALIGDFKECGLKTRAEYRHALEVLKKRAHIKISETCRTRQKATTGTTTEGTKAKLLTSSVWDINSNDNNHRNNHLTTTEQPPNNHEQEQRSCLANPDPILDIDLVHKKNEKKEAIKKDVTLLPSNDTVISFSVLSNLEQPSVSLETRVFVENNKLDIGLTDLIAWEAYYGKKKLLGTLKLLMGQSAPIAKPGGWMMKALSGNYFLKNENWKICQKFQKQFPMVKIKVMKSYSTDLQDNSEISYLQNEEDLVKKLNQMVERQIRRA